MKHISNKEIAHILREMATFYEMKDVKFKPRAYERAALGVKSFEEEVSELYKKEGVEALLKIPGIGKGIAIHLETLIKTGRFKEYEALKKKMPIDVEELSAIEGVGPQAIKVFWKKLKIKNLSDLERAVRTGKIRNLPGFGKKSEEKILSGIEFLKQSGGRKILGLELPAIKQLEKTIAGWPEVKQAIIAGSVRRFKETIGDIDILVASARPEQVMEKFLGLHEIAHVYGKGKTKTNVKLKNGLDADIRVVPSRSWGAALSYFTGSKTHNIALRKRALEQKMKLSEYGLFRGKKFLAGRSEEELYKKLGLPYIEPELREMTGEIKAGEKNMLPHLIEYKDLRGDLQIQTTWTDGKNSIEEMAEAARKLGLEYIAITDHTKSLPMTRGADEKKLEQQIRAIDKINRKFKIQNSKFKILTGAEVNIAKDGTLDIKNETLKKLDVVGAAVHSHFTLSKDKQTNRIERAMKNPHVDIIFHLTARIINRRKALDLDIDKIIKTAKQTGTILEIDAYPERSDISDRIIRKSVETGVKMSINSDAHRAEHLKFLEYGVHQARRGWAEKKDIINAWPLKKMLSMLK